MTYDQAYMLGTFLFLGAIGFALILGGARNPDSRPYCFGSGPGPQQRAENGCNDCLFRAECRTARQWRLG